MPPPVDSPIQPCLNQPQVIPEDKQEPAKHWIKFKIQDKNQKPVPGVTVQIQLPDGSLVERSSDANGMIEINNVQPGNCKIVTDWKDLTADSTIYLHDDATS